MNQLKTDTGKVLVSAVGSSTATSSAFAYTTLSPQATVETFDDEERVERAVYAHIRALRSLGQTSANTMEISKALGIPEHRVTAILHKLYTKGVKIAG